MKTRFRLPLLHVVLALMLATALAVPASARDWLRAETPNFVVYSDGYEHELQRWAKKIEMFDLLLRKQFNLPAGRKGTKLVVYMLKDERAVSQLVGRKYLTGLYSPSTEGSYAVTNRKPAYYAKTMSGQATLFHEYAHHFMYRHFNAAYPAWYREGFAEYVATAAFDIDGTWKFGLPATWRRKHLEKDPLPIEAILFADAEARRGQLDTYLDRFAAGKGAKEAAMAFGNIDTLEGQLRGYAKAGYRYTVSSDAISYSEPIPVTELGPVKSRLIDIWLERKVGRGPAFVLEPLQQLALANPDNADVLYELAMAQSEAALKAKAGDFAAAEATVDRALAIDPEYVRINALKANLTFRRLVRGEDKKSREWLAGRQRLIKAMKADVNDPLPFLALFQSFARQGSRIPRIGHAAIERAFRLQPENREIRTGYALSLAWRGRYDEAEQIARVLASDPHAAATGKRTLANVRRIKAARASSVSAKELAE